MIAENKIEVKYLVDTQNMDEDYQPYVYRFKNKNDGRWYVGSRTKKGCNPEDGYLSSCQNKKFQDLILQDELENNPQNWIKEILFIGTKDEVIDYEGQLLLELDARNDPMSFNANNNFYTLGKLEMKCQHCGGTFDIGNYSQNHGDRCKMNPNLTKEQLEELELSKKTKQCEYCNEWMQPSVYATHHGNKCPARKDLTPEQLERIRKPKQCEYCGEWCSISNYGQRHGANCFSNPNLTKEQIKINRGYILCEHCNTLNDAGNHKLRHGDNCEKNPNRTQEQIDEFERNKRPYYCVHCKEWFPNSAIYLHGDACLSNPANTHILDQLIEERKLPTKECKWCGGHFNAGDFARWHSGTKCRKNPKYKPMQIKSRLKACIFCGEVYSDSYTYKHQKKCKLNPDNIKD